MRPKRCQYRPQRTPKSSPNRHPILNVACAGFVVGSALEPEAGSKMLTPNLPQDPKRIPNMSPESPKRDPQTTKPAPISVQERPDGIQIAQTGSETEFGTKKGGLRHEKVVVFGIQNGSKIDPKASRMDPKSSHGLKTGPTGSQREAKGAPREPK